MKGSFASVFILIAVVTMSCKHQRPKGSELAVEWELIQNSYQGENAFLSEFRIINQSTSILKDTTWTLFLNFSACRPIHLDKVPTHISIQYVAGDFIAIRPGRDFKELHPGDTLRIPIVASPWVIKETDAPSGLYFTFQENGKESAPEICPYSVFPFVSPAQTMRNQEDQVPVPTAQRIFEANASLQLLSSEALFPILPSPADYVVARDSFTFPEATTLACDSSLHAEANYFAERWTDLFHRPLTISHTVSEASTILLRLGAVHIKGKKYSAGSEAYQLSISEKSIQITGTDRAGIFYGIQSLRQLIPIRHFRKREGQVRIPQCLVNDAPRFPYRGMMLDVGRNFQSKESVLALLEVMSFYKLNTFHFHLVDDEGWRIEIPGLPELTSVGARRGHTRSEREHQVPFYGSGPDVEKSSGSGYFSREDFIEILRYATERHIEVIPELDMPGHARAAIKAMRSRYLNYLEKGDTVKATEYLLHDLNDQSVYASVQNYNDNVVCVCQSSTYTFLEKVITEISVMFQEAKAPLTTIHTGGDEVPHGVWEKSPVCQQLMQAQPSLKNAHDLKAYFLNNFSALLAKRNLITAGWEEIGLHLEKVEGQEQEIKTVNPDYIHRNFRPYVWNSVYGWGGDEIGYKLANAGYPVVLSNVTHLYFDLAYNKDPKEPGFYWGGTITAEEAFRFNPMNIYESLQYDLNGAAIPAEVLQKKTMLSSAGKKNILGIQAQLWSETIKSRDRMEYMLYPRVLCLAERAWGYTQANSARDWNRMANTLGQKELPRMDYWMGGLAYRIPVPGARVVNGLLEANVEFPGFVIRYSTDGKDPDINSPVYEQPIAASGSIRLRCFSQQGRAGRVIRVEP
ncbi:MAG: carbohydate-binding domain-containing protein [Cytophagaceae bacterium]|jgi:hexosaminidase|nr:carbohydate-binding domain-containing protein [Cytophagaceae bacterium]